MNQFAGIVFNNAQGLVTTAAVTDDYFDISIAMELQDLVDRVKQKRSIGTRAARNIVIDLLCQEVNEHYKKGGAKAYKRGSPRLRPR